MSYEYEVLGEEDAMKARSGKLEDGIYKFKVVEAKFGYSEAGNPKINLTLDVNFEGKIYKVWTMLIGMRSMIWKTKHFCDATGQSDLYEAGKFDENYCVGKEGLAKIVYVPERPKNDGTNGVWKAKNDVEDFLVDDTALGMQPVPAPAAQGIPNPFAPKQHFQQPAKPAPATQEFVDSDIPF